MSYGSALGVTAPTVSVTAGPTYATQVNAYLEALRAVVEAKVTPGGISISSDLSFLASGTFHSAVDLLTAAFEVQDVGDILPGAHPVALFAGGTNGDLYFNDAAGNQIQVTSAGGLNAATTGGITGTGYGSSGVAVNWSAGNVAYRFFSGASTYADVVCDDLLLNDGDTNFISIVSPALAADYTLTLPAAVPATSNTVLAMSTAGVVTATATPTVTSLTTTGAATVGTTLGVTGLITATAGLTAAANQHVTVSGTGRYKHGQMVRVISCLNGFVQNISTGVRDGNQLFVNPMTTGEVQITSLDARFFWPLAFDVGERIISIRLIFRGGDASTKTLTFHKAVCALNLVTVGTETATSNATASTLTDVILTCASSGFTVAPDTHVYASFTPGSVADFVSHIEVTFDRP